VDKNTFKFIKNVDQIATANFPLEDYTDYSGFYYERNGAWVNEDKLVQATYETSRTWSSGSALTPLKVLQPHPSKT